MPSLERYRSDLARLAAQGRLRSLSPPTGVDFTSNDYLGLARAPRLAEAVTAAIRAGTPLGAGGSRLLRGNAAEHEKLEAVAAEFFEAERTLYFASGYLANFALLSTLPQHGDLVVIDELVHASTRDGLHAGRARFAPARHNDAAAVERTIEAYRTEGGRGQIWIAVESLYSMDGDRAPLADLAAVAERHDAFLLIDEAHATGVYGPQGRGLAAGLAGLDHVIAIHTCSKALGCAGALVSLPAALADFLVNRCRAFLFATAPSPVMAAAALESIAILREEPQRRSRLAALVELAGRELQSKLGLSPSGSQVQPVIIGADAPTMAAAAALRSRGFDVRGIRPPTVPRGSARLRISITLNVEPDSVRELIAGLADTLRGLPLACGVER